MIHSHASRRRAVRQRTCGIISLIGSFAVLTALFGFAYLHDYAPNYHAAQLAMIVLGAAGLFTAILALILGAEET